MKVTSLLLTKDYVYTAARDCKVHMMNWEGEVVKALAEHPGPVNAIALLPRCGDEFPWPVLVSTDGGGMIKAWNAATLKRVASRRVHDGPIECCAGVPSLGVVVTGAWDNHVCIFNPETNLVAAQLKGHGGIVRCLWVDDDRSRIVSGSDDRTIAVWCYNAFDMRGEKAVVPMLYQLQGPKMAVVTMCVVLRYEAGDQPVPTELSGAEAASSRSLPSPTGAGATTSSYASANASGKDYEYRRSSYVTPVGPTPTAPWRAILAGTQERTLFAWEFCPNASFQHAPQS